MSTIRVALSAATSRFALGLALTSVAVALPFAGLEMHAKVADARHKAKVQIAQARRDAALVTLPVIQRYAKRHVAETSVVPFRGIPSTCWYTAVLEDGHSIMAFCHLDRAQPVGQNP